MWQISVAMMSVGRLHQTEIARRRLIIVPVAGQNEVGQGMTDYGIKKR